MGRVTMADFEFHVLNVGQGSANVLITPENHCLLADIEGTSLGKHEPQPTHEYITKYLSSINSGDGSFEETHLLISHHDDDHAGNHELIAELDLDRVWVPRTNDVENAVGRKTAAKTIENISQAGVPSLSTDHNNNINISDEVSIDILSPPPSPVNEIDDMDLTSIPRNDNSLCLLIEYGNLTILYPGDAQKYGIQWVTEKDPATDVNYLIAPHHGSSTGNHTELLDHCAPDNVIISSAHKYQDARYGHPHPDFLSELNDRDITSHWTAVHGNIKITTDGCNWNMTTQSNYSTSPPDLHSSVVDQDALCDFTPEV
jgi:competence protein ComEC